MKIEVGKYYLNGRNQTRGPMQDTALIDRFSDGERYYTPEGLYAMIGGKYEPDLNLIAEVVNTQPEQSVEYKLLQDVLNEAFQQASGGKGKERHANGRDFDRQPIMEIGRMVGVGYQTGQAMKKTQEAVGMLKRDQPDRAIAELLGAIVYLSAAVLLIREN